MLNLRVSYLKCGLERGELSETDAVRIQCGLASVTKCRKWKRLAEATPLLPPPPHPLAWTPVARGGINKAGCEKGTGDGGRGGGLKGGRHDKLTTPEISLNWDPTNLWVAVIMVVPLCHNQSESSYLRLHCRNIVADQKITDRPTMNFRKCLFFPRFS